ncbi:Na+/H+ antiporter NhaA [Sulfurimonas lithotrophica]|uniref:Na(+)/H(+) antiporter NhaA n=1 Tax=Sulfurimonas lithotrophica TaxID=2590022 RepID=A0A5P8P2S8_9BACT|nr:Na+/H+ antiporter NhaA [Sulfurimonas lithotrophica]QFR50038.1 Na+/H+ antiporter NhaA [Sulfurimonas lithotrophica]
MKIYSPWEEAFDRIYSPFEHFLHSQTTSGLVLIAATLFALILANSPLAEVYNHAIHTKIDFSVGSWHLSHSLHHWINDGLMAIFFFMVGLEIKREILVGELSIFKNALLPIIAAIGGMIFPALIYTFFNHDGASANGWGIPMATDIAFAISALVLLGNRVSPALITFLVALAIVDDLGAVLVIAIFYTKQIIFLPLLLAFISFILLLIINRLGVHMILPYFIIGMFMWFFMLESGVHATIAGVLAALTIPSRPKFEPLKFTRKIRDLLDEYDSYPVATDYTTHDKQKAILNTIKRRIHEVGSPAQRLEQALHLPVGLVVIPVFALANAGIGIDFSSISSAIFSDVSLGIISGLVLGKVIGIFGISFLAIKMGITKLPENTTMYQIFGVSFLGGIGFTMSIFVADLAFIDSNTLIFEAKVGVLFASILSGTIGYLLLRNTSPVK